MPKKVFAHLNFSSARYIIKKKKETGSTVNKVRQ